MSYTDSVARVADRTEAALIAARERPDFLAVAVALLAQAQATAAALADLGLATELSRLWARYVAPLGLAAPDAPPPLEEIEAATVGPPSVAIAALGVLTRSVVYESAQTTYVTAMKEQGAERWTRESNTGSCPFCDVRADGTTFPVSFEMWTHKGCNCTPRPTQ